MSNLTSGQVAAVLEAGSKKAADFGANLTQNELIVIAVVIIAIVYFMKKK